MTTDAHLAALAIEYGACLYSCDQDFARFGDELRFHNPLQSQLRELHLGLSESPGSQVEGLRTGR